jgi:sugar phosphate isomerase/epimerase
MTTTVCDRRQFLGAVAAAAAGGRLAAGEREPFRLRYALASCMYGTAAVADILPEVARTGSDCLDVWPRVHGRQREQMEEMGHDAFAALLDRHRVKLGVLTHYDLTIAKLGPELPVAKRFGVGLIVTGSRGPKGLAGEDLKRAVRAFVEGTKPQVDAAAEHGVTLAVENHPNAVIDTPDSLRWLAEMSPSRHLGIALAPHHLPQDPALIASLVRDCGHRLSLFYAWGRAAKGPPETPPKEAEMTQLPGRGPLDFGPILAALAAIDFRGWTEVFMHPTPRGIPIRDTPASVTDEINRARAYLERLLPRARVRG